MGNFFLIADEAGLGKTTIANEIINRAAQWKQAPLSVIYVASNSRIARKNMNEFLDYDPNQIKKFQKDTAIKAVRAMYGKEYEYRGLERKGLNCFEVYKTKLNKSNNISEKIKYQSDRLSMYHKSGIYKDSNAPDFGSFVVSLSPKTSFLQGYMDLPGTDEERKEMKDCLEKLCNKDEKTGAYEYDEFENALKSAIEYEIVSDKRKNDSEKTDKKYSNKLKGLYKIAKEADKVSPVLRRIFENANLILMKPDMIILDEFQRFRDIFISSYEGYSLKQLYEFLYWLKNNKNCKIHIPKLVLLSATPYKYDHSLLKNVWEMELGEQGGSRNTEGKDDDKPFEDFNQLIDTVVTVTGDKKEDVLNNKDQFFERTQRNQYFTNDDIETEKEKNAASIYADENKYKKHLEYLSSAYLIGGNLNPGQEESLKWLEHAPDFWRFCRGYKIDVKCYENCVAASQHLKLATLIEKGMPEGSELLLWVGPVKCNGDLDGSFKEYSKFGKTLVFTHYKMAAKSIAANLTEIAEKRLDDRLKNCDLTRIKDIQNACFETFSLKGNDVDCDICALTSFFNLPYVKKVVCAAYFKEKNILAEYEEMVKAYCEWGHLNDVLLEYAACLKDKSKLSKKLNVVTKLKLGEYYDRESEDKLPYKAAVYYTDDKEDSDEHDKTYEDELGERFNSPFFPFVMTVTATAQEGLDFHKFADKIMHWEPALNVNAFQQREGRIDRMGSITIRRRFYELCKGKAEWNNKNPFQFFEDMKDTGNADKIFDFLPDDKKACLRKAKDAGIFPMWYIPKLSEDSARIERIIAASYFSKEYDAFDRLVRAADDYAKALKK